MFTRAAFDPQVEGSHPCSTESGSLLVSSLWSCICQILVCDPTFARSVLNSSFFQFHWKTCNWHRGHPLAWPQCQLQVFQWNFPDAGFPMKFSWLCILMCPLHFHEHNHTRQLLWYVSGCSFKLHFLLAAATNKYNKWRFCWETLCFFF